MSTHLLLNERPLQVLPTLAAIFGINEAIAIQQIHWVVTIKHEHEDDKTFYQNFMWCKYTLNQWQKKMPWLSSSSIYRLFKKLENEGLVKTCQPYTSSRDQTKWYRIDYKVFQVKSQNPSSQNDDLSSSQNDDLSSSQNDDLSSSQNDQMINTLKDLKNLKKKSKANFFSDSLNQNQAMQQEENSADSANKQNPTPLTPAPKVYADPMGDRFKSGKKHYWQKTIAERPEWQEVLIDWAGSQDCKFGFKESLLIAQMEYLKKHQKPCERGDAMGSLANYIKNDDFASFDLRVDAAIAYEKALSTNPTLKQEAESPQTSTQAMPQVGEIDANGTRLVIDCRWSHFYPRSGRLAKKADGETQVFWDIESRHPPEPISDRLSKFFAEKLGNDLEKIKALLEAKHYAHESLKGYDYQVQMFVDQKSELVTAFNQEIEKLLHLQAA